MPQGPVKLVGGALEINLGFQLPFPSPKQHTSCDNTEVVTPDRECFQGYRSTIREHGEALQTKPNRLSAESERPDRRVRLTPTHLALYIVSTRFGPSFCYRWERMSTEPPAEHRSS